MTQFLLKITMFISCFAGLLRAATGDTLRVQAHNGVDMVWYGNYDQEVDFPDGADTYQKILMHYTIGCASEKCSDWDYTVHLEVGEPTGTFQDNIVSIDTFSIEPLIIDTTFETVEVMRWIELARMITPYGTYMDNQSPAYGTAGFDDQWTHHFVFDVSDYVLQLRDTKTVRCFFSGWSTGFSSTISFDFIEGIPGRDVLRLEQVYDHYGMPYDNTTNFETNFVYPKKFYTLPNAADGNVNVFISGHGSDNAGCSEFCSKNYYIKANGTQVAQYNIWRNDCGKNPLKPQGGTWLINRGNWCPGDQVFRNEHNIGASMVGGDSIELNMDFTPYTNGGGSYSLEVQYVQYGPPNFIGDVEILAILSPSSRDEYKHYNPICDNPVIKIKNNGADVLSSCVIEYGTIGGFPCYYEWTGSLDFNEETEVILPLFMWAGYNADNPQFFARVGWPNGEADEYLYNNRMVTSFETPMRITGDFQLNLRTNNKGFENSWQITKDDGTVMYEGSGLSSNFTYTHPIDLPTGCYNFLLTDYGTDWEQGDGLSWWYNLQSGIETAGYVRFEQDGDIIKNFEPDFGDEIRFQFVVDYFLNIDIPEFRVCDEVLMETGIGDTKVGGYALQVFPNPASGEALLRFNDKIAVPITWKLYDVWGKMAKTEKVAAGKNEYKISLQGLVPGLYMIEAGDGVTKSSVRLVVE